MTGSPGTAVAATSRVRRPPVRRLRLFLDTNVFLSFYELSGEDLEELKKLAVAIAGGGSVLYMPDHVLNEFCRRRAGTISESLKGVESRPIPRSYPRMMINLARFDELDDALERASRLRKELLDETRAAALGHELKADGLLDGLFKAATRIEMTSDIWCSAKTRHRLGHPPGKRDSIGDSLNWESLLIGVPDGEDLRIVTKDNDFVSKLDGSLLDEYLASEWHERKQSAVTAYPSLSALFRAHYPDIQLAADLEKELTIDELLTSVNFRATHLAIQKLLAFPEFTPAQVQALVDAADSNSQIRQILLDTDVNAFFRDLIERYGTHVEPASLAALESRLRDPDDSP